VAVLAELRERGIQAPDSPRGIDGVCVALLEALGSIPRG